MSDQFEVDPNKNIEDLGSSVLTPNEIERAKTGVNIYT